MKWERVDNNDQQYVLDAFQDLTLENGPEESEEDQEYEDATGVGKKPALLLSCQSQWLSSTHMGSTQMPIPLRGIQTAT